MAYIPPKKAMMNLDINAPTSGGFESVGQSLLAQKRADESRVAKKDKRNERLMMGLGLLSFGSTMYRGQAKKRAAEISTNQTLSLAKTENESRNLKLIGIIKQNIGDRSLDEMLNDPKAMDSLRSAGMGDFVNSIGRSSAESKEVWDNMLAVDKERVTRKASGALLTKWMTIDPKTGKSALDTVFDNASAKGSIFNPTGASTDQEILTKMLQLTKGELDADITRLYAYAANDVNKSAPFIRDVGSRFKNLLGGWRRADASAKDKDSNHISLWDNVNEEDILSAGHRKMMLMAANINTSIVPTIQNSIAENATENYVSKVTAAQAGDGSTAGEAISAIAMFKIREQDIDNNAEDILGYYVTPIAFRDSMENILEEMVSTTYDAKSGKLIEGSVAQQDAASLYLRLSNPTELEFRKQFYLSSAHSIALRSGFETGTLAYTTEVNRIVDDFAENIVKPENAEQLAQISMLTVLELGATYRSEITPIETDDLSYNSAKVHALLRPSFTIKDNKYVPALGWKALEDQQKENIVFLELNKILSNDQASAEDKRILSESLYNDLGRNLGNTLGTSKDKFIDAFEAWLPKWNSRKENFVSLQGISHRDDNVAAQQLAIRLFGASDRAAKISNIATVGSTAYKRRELASSRNRDDAEFKTPPMLL